jgi:predicted RecB family nuclease
VITGSLLRDLVTCERRVHHDAHSDTSLRDSVSAFVQMLWNGGREYEAEVLSGLSAGFTDLREVPLSERVRATEAAMRGGARIVVGGRLAAGDLLGMPDMLERIDGVWTAGDIKSGSPLGLDGRRPRLEYAVQVALYARLLEETGLGRGDRAFVIGADQERCDVDLLAPYDREGRSIAAITAGLIDTARRIHAGEQVTTGALSAGCKLCHWHTLCESELVAANDLTLLAGVGRSVRQALFGVATSVEQLAKLRLPRPKVPGVGADRLMRLQHRARLQLTPGARPYARMPLGLRRGDRELHFDIEADPSRDNLVYLHGILERRRGEVGATGRYKHFFADGEHGERDAFAATMDFFGANDDAHIYYYSKYERSSFRALQARHPEVCSADDVEALFHPARATDLLFDVIMPNTEWPTRNLSIKTLARFLGFDWRDVDASGASSIAWYDDWVRTGDPAIRNRIVDYNTDDVFASAVVLDGLIGLPVRDAPEWPE